MDGYESFIKDDEEGIDKGDPNEEGYQGPHQSDYTKPMLRLCLGVSHRVGSDIFYWIISDKGYQNILVLQQQCAELWFEIKPFLYHC